MKASLVHLIAVLAGAASALPALAAQRTFVASNGSDTNVCSLISPCRSFGIAITHTDDKGEIVVLDSAGYGRVTVDKSVTITVPPGVYGGLSVFAGTNGVDIATPGVEVVLRGVTINGQGGTHGVNFTSGSKLVLERCTIANMNGDGLRASASNASVYVTDSVFRRNDNGVNVLAALKVEMDVVMAAQNVTNGVMIDNGATMTMSRSRSELNGQHGVVAGGNLDFVTTTLVLSDTVISGNLMAGLRADANGATGNGRTAVDASKARITGNLLEGIGCRVVGAAQARCSVRDSYVAQNTIGLSADGAGAHMVASRNVVTHSGGPGLLQQNSAQFFSRTNNTVHDNVLDTLGTITPVAPL